jgi:EAL domain-containing protein (putative c-di-GMP-specific phosphodiesterase class I)/CheY-like chemotaxis protein
MASADPDAWGVQMEASEDMSEIKVLVAEDDPLTREVLITVINEAGGFNVVGTADDAQSAIAMAMTVAPDLVLLDVRMPGGGGALAASVITASLPGMCVVAISAYDDAETVGEMMNAGASGYLTKDASHSSIIETLRRCAAGESVFTPAAASTVMRDYAMSSRRLEKANTLRREREARMLEACNPAAIHPVFQPIIDLVTSEAVMTEALTRFDTVYKFNTGEWFEEAHELGMGKQLELATLRKAVREVEEHGDPSLTLSINVSPGVLIDPELTGVLANLDARNIVLEITEYARVTDYDVTRKTIEGLRDQGVRVAIDDAGAGYSSLRHILDLMPDLIKLDISLVRSIDTDRARYALAAGLTSFAREIGASIVAEGIETEEELNCLRQLGVELGQGFHLAMPMPLNGNLPLH